MTGEAQDFIQHCLDTYPIQGNVLEIGSLDVNGSPKWHFREGNQWTKATAQALLERFPGYIGIDILSGRNVDFLVSSHDIVRTFGSAFFDLIVSAEMLEHDSEPWTTAAQIRAALKPGGHLILTTCGFNTLYHHPPDHFRYSLSGIESLFKDLEILELALHNECPMLCARKR